MKSVNILVTGCLLFGAIMATDAQTFSLDQKQIVFDLPQKVSFGPGAGIDPLSGSIMIMTSAFTTDSRGKTVAVTYTMSTPGYLNVIDIETNSVVEYYVGPETGESFAWSICKLASGDVVYAGVTQGGTGYIYKYDPAAKTFTRDATIPSGYYLFGMTSYGTDLYFGTYSSGRVMKYNTVTKVFTTLWQSGFSYVRGVDVYNGKIYAGISTSSYDNCIYEIDTATGTKKNIPLPGSYKTIMNNGLTPDQIAAANCEIQSLMIRGDIAVISFIDKRATTTKNWMMLYNVKTSIWAPMPSALPGNGGYQGFCPTPVLDGYTYAPYNGAVWSIDTSTGATSNTNKQAGPFFRGSYITPATGKQPIIYTLQAYGQLQKMDLGSSGNAMAGNTQLTLQAGPQTVRSLAAGPDGRLYVGGYLSSIGAIYNPSNQVATKLTGIEQTEGIGYYNGKMYLGCYSGATIRRVDAYFGQTLTTIAAEAATFKVEGQDRPYVVVGGEENLYVGTVPPIGQNGGAISISKGPGTAQYIIPAAQFSIDASNLQSVAGIAPFKVDGNEWFYAGSNVSGGTNAASKGEQAVISLFDQNRNLLSKNTMAEMAAAGVTITEKPQSIGHLIYSSNDGLIYGATMKSIFAIDPEHNRIVKYKQISNAADRTWNPVAVQLGPDGILCTGIGGYVTLIDPKNFENYVVISGANLDEPLVAVGSDNAVYYARGTSVYRIGTELVDGNKIPQISPTTVYVRNGLLYMSGLTVGETLNIYSVTGALIYQSVIISNQMNIPWTGRGIYIVQTGNKSIKFYSGGI